MADLTPTNGNSSDLDVFQQFWEVSIDGVLKSGITSSDWFRAELPGCIALIQLLRRRGHRQACIHYATILINQSAVIVPALHRSTLRSSRGSAYLDEGDLDAADADFASIVYTNVASESLAGQSEDRIQEMLWAGNLGLGRVARARNLLDEARAHFKSAVRVAKKAALSDLEADAIGQLLYVDYGLHLQVPSKELIARANELFPTMRSPRSILDLNLAMLTVGAIKDVAAADQMANDIAAYWTNTLESASQPTGNVDTRLLARTFIELASYWCFSRAQLGTAAILATGAMTLSQEHGLATYEFQARNLLAHITRSDGDQSRLRELHQWAVAAGNKDLDAACLGAMGIQKVRTERYEDARTLLEQGIGILEEARRNLRAVVDRSAIGEQLAYQYELLAYCAVRRPWSPEALFEVAQRSKARSSLEALVLMHASASEGPPPGGHVPEPAHRQHLESRMLRAWPIQPLTSGQLKTYLEPGMVVLETLAVGDLLCLLVIRTDKDGITDYRVGFIGQAPGDFIQSHLINPATNRYWVDPKESPLDRGALQWLLRRGHTRIKADDQQTILQLARALTHPLINEGLIRAKDQLIVAPHRELHLVPWGCLPIDESNSSPLAEFVDSISIIPTAASLQFWRNKHWRIQGRSHFKAVVFYWPGSDLADARREAEEIADRFGTAAIPVPDPDGVLSAIAGADLVHFAAHSFFEPENGQRAYLGCRSGAALTAERIASEASVNDCLVVLSSCHAARSTGRLSDDRDSLQRAFVTAGAAAVIASLTPLRDASAPILMAQLYDELENQKAPAAALTAAQRSCRGRLDSMSWGYFTTYGGL